MVFGAHARLGGGSPLLIMSSKSFFGTDARGARPHATKKSTL
eukprot:CAMPEP_0195073678 /NCGR_PEP_ID=MMETSP0448-20130528/16945_1 /TAXON_ID=66468 /ORGANISM="Heterocapsa triquestra, Strain CCMP 448" /LENGTH=41 /DNA_ID= /DNA_START= /DNA_END= /DNA_ORIENTATION=